MASPAAGRRRSDGSNSQPLNIMSGWNITQQIIQIDPEVIEQIQTPENSNYRMKEGKLQFFNVTTSLWHDAWIDSSGGVPVLKLADTGEA